MREPRRLDRRPPLLRGDRRRRCVVVCEERTADDRLKLAQRHPEDMTEVHDRQARLAVGVAPLLGHGVGLRPTDAQHAGGFFHRQQRRKATLHSTRLDTGCGLYHCSAAQHCRYKRWAV